MNKTSRNFWIDITLFLLLGIDIALVGFPRREAAGIHPGFAWHAHAIISILLTLGCLVHAASHWRWFQAVLTGKAKGRMKLIMNGAVVITMLLANVSGHTVLESGAASRLHSLTGYFALIGLVVHAVKRIHWMAGTAKRFITAGGQENTVPSA
ncbi:MAG: hypothetical protein JW730_04405 [Anaerolineales bacterium]|nr:hypothetical protein [Anaerolineales bacterium]